MTEEKPEGTQPSKPSDEEEKSKSSKDDTSEKVQETKSDNKDTQDTAQKNKQPKISPPVISVKELINQMTRMSVAIKNKRTELVNAKNEKSDTKKMLAKINHLLKPQKRQKRKLGEPKKVEDSDDRKLLKNQKNALELDLINHTEIIDRLQEEFNRLCGSEKNTHDYQKLQSKAESKKYVRENKFFLLDKAYKLLKVSLSNQKDSLLDLHIKAGNDSEEGISTFNSSLRELLFVIDEEGAILCSGTASKSKVYAAVRKALQAWDPQSETIPELVWPKE